MLTAEQLQELRAQATAKVQATVASIKQTAEVARLQSIISGNLGQAMANQAITEQASAKLTSLLDECAGIVTSIPIYSKATRESRKFNPSKVYGFGNQISNLLGLLSGIQYSASEHKALLLAHTGLSEDLIEQTLEAFGRPAYYSANYSTVIEEQPYDAAKALDCIKLIEAALDVELDKTKVTPTTFKSQFELARIKAETAQAASELAVMKTIKIGE